MSENFCVKILKTGSRCKNHVPIGTETYGYCTRHFNLLNKDEKKILKKGKRLEGEAKDSDEDTEVSDNKSNSKSNSKSKTETQRKNEEYIKRMKEQLRKHPNGSSDSEDDKPSSKPPPKKPSSSKKPVANSDTSDTDEPKPPPKKPSSSKKPVPSTNSDTSDTDEPKPPPKKPSSKKPVPPTNSDTSDTDENKPPPKKPTSSKKPVPPTNTSDTEEETPLKHNFGVNGKYFTDDVYETFGIKKQKIKKIDRSVLDKLYTEGLKKYKKDNNKISNLHSAYSFIHVYYSSKNGTKPQRKPIPTSPTTSDTSGSERKPPKSPKDYTSPKKPTYTSYTPNKPSSPIRTSTSYSYVAPEKVKKYNFGVNGEYFTDDVYDIYKMPKQKIKDIVHHLWEMQFYKLYPLYHKEVNKILFDNLNLARNFVNDYFIKNKKVYNFGVNGEYFTDDVYEIFKIPKEKIKNITKDLILQKFSLLQSILKDKTDILKAYEYVIDYITDNMKAPSSPISKRYKIGKYEFYIDGIYFSDDVYKIFSIPKQKIKDLNKSSLKKQYFKLSREYHPDNNSNNPSSKEKFQLLNQANSVINKYYDSITPGSPKK